jgi:hypothetical protein
LATTSKLSCLSFESTIYLFPFPWPCSANFLPTLPTDSHYSPTNPILHTLPISMSTLLSPTECSKHRQNQSPAEKI